MKMKKLIAFVILALALSVFASTIAIAEEIDNVETVNEVVDITETEVDAEFPEIAEDPGATPDQPFRYGIDRALERISLALTFGKAAKAQKGLEHARERLLEVKAMMLQKKAAQAERARELYEESISEASENLEGVEEDGTESRILETARNTARLQLRIENQEEMIESLKTVLTEQDLPDDERAKLEAVLARMEEKAADVKAKAEAREEKVKDRLRAVTGKSEDEVEQEVADAVEEEIGEARQEMAERRIERTEEALERLRARIGSEKMKGVDTNIFESHLSDIEAKLNEAKTAYESGNYEEVLGTLKPVNNYGRQLSLAVKLRNEARIKALSDVKERELAKFEGIKERIKERLGKLKESLPEESEEVEEEAETEMPEEGSGQEQQGQSQ